MYLDTFTLKTVLLVFPLCFVFHSLQVLASLDFTNLVKFNVFSLLLNSSPLNKYSKLSQLLLYKVNSKNTFSQLNAELSSFSPMDSSVGQNHR